MVQNSWIVGSRFSNFFQKMLGKNFSRELFSTNISLLFACVLYACIQIQSAQGKNFRYSMDSCTDLTPREVVNQPANYEASNWPPPAWRSSNGNHVRQKRDPYGSDPPSPVRITVPVHRYKRNSDLKVQTEGRGHYDAMMLQGRSVSTNGEFVPGGVGIVGVFQPRYLESNFSHLQCFRLEYGTVVDGGRAPQLGNISFTWTSPDADAGSIRFLAGITKGIHYWIVVSNILHFNPYPISTAQCGAIEACFRICPLDDDSCMADQALMIYAYNTDIYGKRDVEFTMGGILNTENTYLAVVYSEDNDRLNQADVTVCYVEHGRARIEHLRLQEIDAPLLQDGEEIELDDYDIDGNTLWCRFRRALSSSVIHPHRSNFILLYRGELDLQGYPRFKTPSREIMYSSDMKLNLTTPANKRYSGSLQISQFCSSYLVVAFAGLSILRLSFTNILLQDVTAFKV